MGLNTHSLSILVDWMAQGGRLGDTLTLGRLQLVTGRYESIESFHSILRSASGADERTVSACKNVDDVLRLFGATSVASLDRSGYEGASILHDLNEPLDQKYRASFDTVIDGGTLEHVFNFPVAIKSCMELVRPGGSLVICTPMNNQPGHGFYQFTPELFYRVLSKESGYHVTSMIAYEKFTGGRRYQVVDPEILGRRLRLVNHHPTELVIIARRESVAPVLASPPQQSDYAVRWAADAEGEKSPRASDWRLRLVQELSRRARRWAPGLHHRVQSLVDQTRRAGKASFEDQREAFRRVED
jgi:SAM-dependent methyltransferase